MAFITAPKHLLTITSILKGNYAYLTNYTSGLRVVDITDIGNANLNEVASFDGYPANDNATFAGAWSNYPFFDSGIVIMSDFQGGLFILEPKLCKTTAATTGLSAQASGDNSITLDWTNDLNPNESYNIYRSDGGCSVDNFKLIASSVSTNNFNDTDVSGQATIGYKISKTSGVDQCESERSQCVETITTGTCSIAPQFSGVTSVNTTQTNTCGMTVSWGNATGYCSNQISYNIYKSSNPAFVPNDSNRVATGIRGTNWHDILVTNGIQYYYNVRATDLSNQTQDTNNVKLADNANGNLINGDWSAGAEIGDFGFGQNRHVGWEINSTLVHTGNRSYWGQNQSNTCNDLLSNSIHLTAGENSVLSFWTAFGIEDQYDGGVVEITNNNNQFNALNLSPNYPNSFNNSSNACGYTLDTPSFSGRDLSWKQYTVDLSNYQGQDIKIRWNYSSDGSQNEEGWFLDDIKVTNTQVPSACSTLSDAIYQSSFE